MTTIWWTDTKLTRLKNAASERLGWLNELFAAHGIHLEYKDDEGNQHKGCAWGQFLDGARRDDQYGLYGTSAGIQVLALADPEGHREMLDNCISVMLAQAGGRFQEKGDMAVTYKLCYLVEALYPLDSFVKDYDQYAKLLIERVLPGAGWGEWFCLRHDKDDSSDVLATAAALLALRKYLPFRETGKKCKAALSWLCEEEKQKRYDSLYELALTAWALTEYQELKNSIPLYDEALRSVTKRMLAAIGKRRPWRFGIPDMYHYTIKRRENKYMWFLSDCMAAYVLLKMGCPKPARQWVLGVVEYFAKNLTRERGFVPANTQRVSTLDQLWIARLLAKFYETSLDQLKPSLLNTWVALPRYRQVGIIVFLVALIIIAAAVQFRDLMVVVSAVVLGICPSLIPHFLGGEHD